MRLKAEVQRCSGKTIHFIGTFQKAEQLPPPAWVEIVQEAEGFYLLRYNSEGHFLADTWHQTLAEAKEQAQFEYYIEEKDWIKC